MPEVNLPACLKEEPGGASTFMTTDMYLAGKPTRYSSGFRVSCWAFLYIVCMSKLQLDAAGPCLRLER